MHFHLFVSSLLQDACQSSGVCGRPLAAWLVESPLHDLCSAPWPRLTLEPIQDWLFPRVAAREESVDFREFGFLLAGEVPDLTCSVACDGFRPQLVPDMADRLQVDLRADRDHPVAPRASGIGEKIVVIGGAYDYRVARDAHNTAVIRESDHIDPARDEFLDCLLMFGALERFQFAPFEHPDSREE